MTPYDQYAFALNLYKSSDPLPIAITDKIELNLSTTAQAERIQELLRYYGNTMHTGQWRYSVEPLDAPLKGGHIWKQVPPKQAKYWVLNFLGDDMPIWRFGSATQLTAAELEIGATFYPAHGNSIKQLEPARLFHYWEQHRQPITQPLNVSDLRNAAIYQDKIEALAACKGKAEQAVVRVYSDFVRLSMGPRAGDLPCLATSG